MAQFFELESGLFINLNKIITAGTDFCEIQDRKDYQMLKGADAKRLCAVLRQHCESGPKQKFHQPGEYLLPEDYAEMPYHVVSVMEDDNTFFATVQELKGCMTDADTWEELGESIDGAIKDYVAILQADGKPIPLPVED